MSERPNRVYTIASDAPFLDVLATAVLQGFPHGVGKLEALQSLASLTILVPTRRAARELQNKLLVASGKPALVMPHIRPIGDLDEDILEAPDSDFTLPNAISPIGRQFALIALIDEWAASHPHLRLAQELANSPQQAQALAMSLGELIDSLETEEVSLERLPDAYAIDLAIHREAILGLLDVVRKEMPALLLNEGLMGGKERRSRLIRLEAKRLMENPPAGAVIAAGSTGTIPATRELLAAISKLENGAVILPGLDQEMDDESWGKISAQHPQHSLKQLVEAIGLQRRKIPELGAGSGKRAWLASELMRPSDVADRWHLALTGKNMVVKEILSRVSFVEARDKNDEALIIALVMRRELERPVGDIALVTPDRDLARRVKANLARWNIKVDDSAGEPLIRFGAAALLVLLMDAVESGFSATSLTALFAHHLTRFGFKRENFVEVARNIELALFRAAPMGYGLDGLLRSFEQVAAATQNDSHRHPLTRRLDEGDWQRMREVFARIAEMLTPISSRGAAPFLQHLETLIAVAENIASDEFWSGAEAETLQLLLETFRQESRRFPQCNFNRAAATLRQHLQLVPFRENNISGTRLAILGLLEARLIRPETVILGGLNEGTWPRQPDPGPWLNRPMRDVFGMQQPERHIGQSAHDFVQAFGADRIFLSWSRRDGMEPAIPSRWILRLQAILKAVDLKIEALPSDPWQAWASGLDQPETIAPAGKPLPRPPVSARPQRLSVTRIETLIRDPYAIYAEMVLGLNPLADISATPDAALRGTLFHAAIGEFFTLHPQSLPANALEKLLAIGEKHFRPFRENAEVIGFWWLRFQRLADWIVESEVLLREGVRLAAAEVKGHLPLKVGDTEFTLSARADRIDIFADGQARIIDFKTGDPPSAKEVSANFSPQLTLEAAMLENSAFEGLGRHETRELAYIKITGGIPPGELKPVDIVPMDAARWHLASLIGLLNLYQRAEQAYIPRHAVQSEDEARPFDHLSRYREWILAGES